MDFILFSECDIHHRSTSYFFSFFFFNDTATTEIYTLSLHDALPIYPATGAGRGTRAQPEPERRPHRPARRGVDRKSTRLNSSHVKISYAVFCLKKKKKKITYKQQTNQ